MTILEALDIILKESESLSLDSAADRKRLRDNFEHLMRSQDAHGHTKVRGSDGVYTRDYDQPLYRLQ